MINIARKILWDVARIHDAIGSAITYLHVRNRDRSWQDAKYLFENRGDRQDSLLAAGQHLHPRTSRVAHAARYEFARNHFNCSVGERILDIACGLGYASDILSDTSSSTYVGIDIDKTAIRYARRNYEGESRDYLLGSGSKLPLCDNSINYVTSFETMEHISNDTEFLAELNRVTTDSASFVISVPYNESKNVIQGQWNQSKDYPHVNTYTFDSFRNKLQRAFEGAAIDIYEQKEPETVLTYDPPADIPRTVSRQLSDHFEKRQKSDPIHDDSPALLAHVHP